jgi:leucyl aminopeptidase
MKLTIVTGDITKLKVDGLIVGMFEDALKPVDAAAAVDKALCGGIAGLVKSGEIKGKPNEINILYSLGQVTARVVAAVGLGKKAEYDMEKVRAAAGQACRALGKYSCISIAVALPVSNAGAAETVQAIAEGSLMGLYTFKKYFTKKPENKEVSELQILNSGKAAAAAFQAACRKGEIIAEAVNSARDMSNEPGNFMKPVDMAKAAQKIAARYDLGLKVMDRPEMEREGMGGLLGVAQGSNQPPKFIVLSYKGDKSSKKVAGFIGKGLTFDSGGISIKPSEHMQEMKGDMSGGAAVLAAMEAIARLKIKANITGIVAATENMPGGSALKPGDIIKAANGKTIEVVNTDAEGRLTLADALSYAVAKGMNPLVDVATLTGACMVALGDIYSGAFTNDAAFLKRVLQASEKGGELLWELPMKEDYRELNKSDIADVKNSGGRYGGAISAAMFLSEFVGKTPWVHIDIAGTMLNDKDKGYAVKGASGVTVRTLVALAESFQK